MSYARDKALKEAKKRIRARFVLATFVIAVSQALTALVGDWHVKAALWFTLTLFFVLGTYSLDDYIRARRLK